MLFLKSFFTATMNYSCLDQQIEKFRELASAYREANAKFYGERFREVLGEE